MSAADKLDVFALPVHPAAALFPMLPADELAELADNIKAHGLVHPVVVKDGVLIDGRNRREACRIAGVVPAVVELNGVDPLAYVISANVHRRHLTTAQRAAIAAELANMRNGTNQHAVKVGGSNDPPTPITVEQAASMLNVGTASVKRARHVMHTDSAAHEAAKRGEKPKPKPASEARAAKPATAADAEADPRAVADREIREARETLGSMTAKERFDRACAKAFEALQARFRAEVYAAVRANTLKERARMLAEMDQYRAERDKLRAERSNVHRMLTLDEFKLVRSCLHPDRLTSVDPERLHKAYLIFARLQVCADPDKPPPNWTDRKWANAATRGHA